MIETIRWLARLNSAACCQIENFSKANEARACTRGPRSTIEAVATVGGCVAGCFDQAALISPSWVSAVTPSSRPISSTILPLITLSTVVPVKCILRPVAGRDRALPAGGRTADGRRGWPRRKNHRRAGRRARPLLRGHSQLPRSAADHVRADRALLSALQGPGKGQMGHHRQVARRDRRRKTRTRGDRARGKGASEGARQARGHAGTYPTNRRPSEGTVEKMTKIMRWLSRPPAAPMPTPAHPSASGMHHHVVGKP